MGNTNTKPFGVKDKIGYMCGDIANDFTFIFASSYVMVFYTKVMGVSAGMVGTMFLLARCLDAFTDIGMGRIVDNSKPTKNGRIRPWILRMCAFVALASFMMYQSFLVDAPYAAKVAYMFITYILWGSIFYTSVNIPYGSMASVISSEPKDRSSLSVFRSLGGTLAGILIGMLAPMVVYYTDEAGNKVVSASKISMIAGIFSVLAVICYLLSVMLYADNRTCRVCTEAGCPEEDVRTDGFRTVFQQIADGSDSLGSAVVVGIFNVPGHQPVSVCRLL